MEKEAPTETDLGSYEGKYPKDLFNKTVIVNEQAMGRVAKETDDRIVVFSDSGNLRFDIPKSKIALSGGSIVVGEPLEQYAVDKDAPMPEARSLRPSAEEIRQKAGEIPAANEKYSSAEEPTLPIEDRKPSMVEEKVRGAATEVKSSVGYELGQASKTVKEKMKDAGEAVVNVDVEGAARQAAGGIKDLAQAGAEAAKEKIGAAQSSTEAGLSVENMMKFEKESKQSSTETDVGSYEGKYPKDLFNKTVIVNEQAMGRVAKETDDQIVVFSDSGNLRFDIPKSKITLSGGSVVVGEPLEQYAVDKDAPMPEARSLRPSAEEIRQKAGEMPAANEKYGSVEGPTLPIEERKPSMVEEKVRGAATEVKSSVGYELGQASKTVKEKMKDAGEAVVNVDVEGAASRIKDVAQSGAEAAKEKIVAAQSSTEAGLSSENMMKFEKESKQSSTETDLGSYEGKYPKDLFNKTVIVNEQAMGRVAKETDDVIVVFSDTDSSIRFDIPKSEISTAGASVIANEDLLFRYRTHRDAPMPEGRALRASVQEI
ncbi:MAG TPA: hypothetical protein VE732_07745, partial [Nitrososphaera sp.]|nr:hypothetical protein [Nitrososphaera sp.]